MNLSRPPHPPRVIQGRFQGGRPAVRWGMQSLARGHAVQLPASLDPFAATCLGQQLPLAVQAKLEEVFDTRLADVRVHVGPQAAALGALAFTSGSDIYFAPGHYDPHSVHGQRLLCHEIAHVVQQRAGRVPNPFGTGVAVVQIPGLEAEAERMSLRLAQRAQPVVAAPSTVIPLPTPAGSRPPAPHVQMAAQNRHLSRTPLASRSVAQPATAKRPGFTSTSKQSAFLSHNLFSDSSFEVNLKQPRLPSHNAAMPHRMSWKAIRDSTWRFMDGEEDATDFERWTDRFIKAGREKIRKTERAIHRARRDRDRDRVEDLEMLLEKQERSQEDFVDARDALLRRQSSSRERDFLRQANSFHANVPDLGPHFGVNNPVGEHTHLHLVRSRHRKRKRSPSPMSRRVLDMSPERLPDLAVTRDEEIITVTGETFSRRKLRHRHRHRFKKHGTKVIKGYNEDFEFD
jgi:Domain of unknown function (DUF4157)